MTLQRKYIPETWDDIYGQSEVVSTLREYRSISELPHLLFAGTPGIGKTACAYVLAKELDVPIVELNGSDDRGIDTVRNEIKTLLFTQGERLILLDEACNLTNDAQAALRRPMEQALQRTNNRLILTVNRPWKIIDAISSRCSSFHLKKLDTQSLVKITSKILKGENLRFTSREELKQVIDALVSNSRGDARKLVNTIDNYSHSKESLLQYIQKKQAEINQVKEVFNASINGDWKDCLMKLEGLLLSNLSLDASIIVEMFYDEVKGLDIDNIHRFQIYNKLAEVERALKINCTPVVQFAGFLMSVMGIVHYGGNDEI